MAITGTSDFDSGNGENFSISGNDVEFDTERDWTGVWNGYWFHVKLSGIAGTTPAITVNFSVSVSLGGVTPVYSYDQDNWYAVSNVSLTSPVMTFDLPAAGSETDVWIALLVPYTYTDLIADMASWESSTHTAQWILGESKEGRNMYYLKVDDITSNNTKVDIVMMCRSHPGETMGNWVGKGMIDWLLADTDEATELRKLARFHYFPMVNPDGVYNGRARGNEWDIDPNRDYNVSGPTEVTEVAETFLCHTRLGAIDTEFGIDFVMDLHGSVEGPNMWYDTADFESTLETKMEGWLATLDTGDYWDQTFDYHVNDTSTTNTTWRSGTHREYGVSSFTVEGAFQGEGANSTPTEAEMLAGAVTLMKAVVRSLNEEYLPCGWTWGHETSVPEQPETWAAWEIKGTGADATNDTDYGKITASSVDVVSPVMDTGNTNSKKITLSVNDYVAGSGTGAYEVRGQSTSFLQDASSPTWVSYTVPQVVTWRYIQVCLKGS